MTDKKNSLIATIFDHADTDPNACKHICVGGVFAIVMSVISLGFGSLFATLAAALLSGVAAGVGIEVVQRIQRYGKQQNTFKESCLDAAVTSLWFILIFRL
ncbi:MAG: hypothetical protein R8M45_08005 [Ghiorsea sp.]